MTAAKCFSPAEVAQWQPRARHYYHAAMWTAHDLHRNIVRNLARSA